MKKGFFVVFELNDNQKMSFNNFTDELLKHRGRCHNTKKGDYLEMSHLRN